MFNLTIAGVVLVALGVLYIRRPTVYRRGLWLKTSLAVRLLSEENYKRYIRGLGVLFIVAGFGLIVWEQVLPRLGMA